jgi:hypothetical protein
MRRKAYGGDVPAEAGSGNTASVKTIRHAASDTVAIYALSEEQVTRKKFLDNSNEPQ